MRHETRHRRSATTTATADVLVPLWLVLSLLVAGCGTVGTGASQGRLATTPEERAMAADLPATPTAGALECGARIHPEHGLLRLTGRFPVSAPAGAQQVDGTVRVTARTTAGSVKGAVVSPRADAFLVRDGRIVTLPLAQDSVGRRVDLADGREVSLPVTAGLVACSGEGTLAPGAYDLYARVVLILEDGSRTDSIAGPWPLQVT